VSNALQQGMTRGEFLAWEAGQEQRYEFDGFRPVAMTGGTRNHAAIQVRLLTALASRLSNSPCEAFGSELKIAAGHSFRYPDAMIVCTPGAGTATVVDDPVVIFEIVSPSTERVDRLVKNEEYRRIPSVQAYVLLQQDFVGATMFQHVGDDWVSHFYGPGTALTLPGVGIDLPLDELYHGLDLPA
jgi:Uma2 family endonuclease